MDITSETAAFKLGNGKTMGITVEPAAFWLRNGTANAKAL